MKLSARNVIKGKVVQVKPGVVNSEVVLEIPGGETVDVDVEETGRNEKPAIAGIRRARGIRRRHIGDKAAGVVDENVHDLTGGDVLASNEHGDS